jgi:hypothetical protein
VIHHIEGETIPEVWLRAADCLLKQEGYSAHTMILDIQQPDKMTPADFRIFDRVDDFLRQHDRYPVVTVAGTIFPGGLYLNHGPAGVYELYPDKIYPKIKSNWGTYAFRILRRERKDGASMNPLQVLVEKLRKQVKGGRAFKAAYELNSVDVFADIPLYDSGADSGRTRNQPCLSHLSFRLRTADSLMLTALYRSHYYVQKTLGNLLGMAQLQSFVSKETGLEVGPLICHSTHAILETESKSWGKSDVEQLVKNCHAAAENIAA